MIKKKTFLCNKKNYFLSQQSMTFPRRILNWPTFPRSKKCPKKCRLPNSRTSPKTLPSCRNRERIKMKETEQPLPPEKSRTITALYRIEGFKGASPFGGTADESFSNLEYIQTKLHNEKNLYLYFS